MTDISFQGTLISIVCPGLQGGKSNLVLDFSDEGTPVEFQNNEVFGHSGNMNGVLITWSRYRPIEFDITAIPNSKTDTMLRNLWYISFMGGKAGTPVNQQQVTISSVTVKIPNITTTSEGAVTAGGAKDVTYGPGKMTVAPSGWGSNAEGKMSARRYHFVMEGINMK